MHILTESCGKQQNAILVELVTHSTCNAGTYLSWPKCLQLQIVLREDKYFLNREP